jgi:hypothetical protein
MKSFDFQPIRPGSPPKPGRFKLNLLIFAIVALALVVLSYQVGHDVASQLAAVSGQSLELPDPALAVVGAVSAPTLPAAPAPDPGSLPAPAADFQVAPSPSSNRPRTVANPTPAANAPPPAKAPTTRPANAKPATPKVQPAKPAQKPVPTTKPS